MIAATGSGVSTVRRLHRLTAGWGTFIPDLLRIGCPRGRRRRHRGDRLVFSFWVFH